MTDPEGPLKRRKPRLYAHTRKIMCALRDARKMAVRMARMHGVPIVYMNDGKLVRERVQAPE